MSLNDPWEIEQVWGSHQPVLLAALEILKPQSAIECGCGNFSTLHMRKHVPNLHTIEHDSQWASRMHVQCPPTPNHKWTVQSFRAKNPTRIHELPPMEFCNINAFYIDLAETIEPFDLLFVDTFTCCRVPAISILGWKAKYIILHDLEPPSPEVYQLNLLDRFFESWTKYIHKPQGIIGSGHQIPWTGLYAQNDIPLNDLNKVILRESQRLWKMNTILEYEV